MSEDEGEAPRKGWLGGFKNENWRENGRSTEREKRTSNEGNESIHLEERNGREGKGREGKLERETTGRGDNVINQRDNN